MIKKVFITIFIVLLSIFLLLVFVFYNFPYDSLIRRIDGALRHTYSVSLDVIDVKYRFPFKFIFDDVRLAGEGMPIPISVRVITFRPGLIGENVVSGEGLRINGNNIEVKNASFVISSKLRWLRIKGGAGPSLIETLNIRIDNAKLGTLHLSGFEFSSFTISDFLLSIKRKGEELRIEKGLCKSELFSSEITGVVTSREIDIVVLLKLKDLFYARYANLTGLVESLTEDDTIRFSIKGDIKTPKLNIESKSGV